MTLLKVEKRGPVTIFTIDNAAKRNVISQATALALQRAFVEFDADSDQRVAIITGAGDEAFTAGADLNDIPEFWRCTPGAGISTDKPIIAAIAGWCIGGGLTLTATCDLAIAAENTKFLYPEAKIGLTQGFITAIAARIPQKVAMEIMLLGRQMDATRAYEVGLINQVVPTGRQLEVALAMAEEIAGMAPLVIRTIKRFVGQIIPQSPSEIYARTLQQLEAIRTSSDLEEGQRAFKEKRAPRFKGR
ncbi:enoyl-CoA hydratase/isomerase family protein [Variovorax paradoxus]|nr:enoyl-CoA hydratase-related protein [Variovorax paradoxus]MBT2304833.1 enoyl-CoA hydratase/isomerase family protein [Variovorax paradoxus]